MPELPQIEPDSGLKVPETVGIQRLNLERPNPALEELKQQGHSVEFQASYLGAALQRQKMATDLLNSESNAVNGFANLKQSLEGVADPDTKLKLLGTGSQQVVDDIIKANPALAPHISDQLNLRRSEFLRDALTQNLADKHAIGQAEYKASLQNLIIAVGNAESHQDELVLKEQGLQRIQQAEANGDITPAEAITDAHNFMYQSQLAKMNSLINRPGGVQQALAMSQKDSGLTPGDFHQFQARALASANHEYDLANQTSKINTLQNLEKFESGKTTSAEDLQLVHFGQITPKQYESKYGHPPDNMSARLGGINYIDNFHGTAQELKLWAANNISGNSNLTAEDKQEMNAHLQIQVNELNTEAGIRKSDTFSDFSNYVTHTYPQLYMPRAAGMGDPYSLQKKQIAVVTSNVKTSIRLAKTPEEEQTIVEKAQTRIDKIMVPLPAVKPSNLKYGNLPDELPKAAIGVE